jgi:RNA polymerase sigma-70 factor (ECF subfamily)
VTINGRPWEETLSRWRPLLRLLAAQTLNRRLWRRVDPSDVVQRTLLEAHQDRGSFQGTSEEDLGAWLQAILRHRIIDEVRKARCQKEDMDLEVGITRCERHLRTQYRSSPSRALVRYEWALRLAEALEKLPEDQRCAVELRHLEGRSLAETAKEMGRTPGSVASLIHRGMVRLRDLLSPTR